MTWIKLEEKAPRHPKVSGLSHHAFRVWVTSLCYASEFLTDGILPPVYLSTIKSGLRDELVAAGLWDVDGDLTRIHDYLGHQSSRMDVDHNKQRNRDKSKAWRDRQNPNVTGNGETGVTSELPSQIQIQIQRTDTENREQTTATPLPPRPLISGESHPRTWGKIHGEHVAGFCDWVCLPEFLFAEFCRKSGQSDKPDGGAAYVRGWAKLTRSHYEGQPVGDNLKFWRAQWDGSHPQAVVSKSKPRPIAEILAERERKSS